MIKLDASEPKEINFDINVSGVGVHELKGAIRLKIGNVEYGFNAYVIDHTIKVIIPPLDSFVKDELLDGQQVSAKLEIIADDTYMVPWEDTLVVETSAKIEVSKVEVGETSKTKVAVTKIQEKPIKLVIEKDASRYKDKKIIKYLTKSAKEVDDRVLRFVGSDETQDRADEVVKSSGWKLKEYRKNPVVMVNHRHTDLPVAKTEKVWIDKEKKALMFDIRFPESDISSEGDTLYKLYKNGYMNATSVGFIPTFEKMKFGKKTGEPSITFNEQELVELSLVSVPANPNALLTGKTIDKAIKEEVVDELEIDELKTFLKDVLCKDVCEKGKEMLADKEDEGINNKDNKEKDKEDFFEKVYKSILE